MSRYAQIDRAGQIAAAWLGDVAAEFGTEDHDFVYRVTRSWLHLLRDSLTVVDAAHLAAQLPDLLRGVYFEGWNPAAVPVRRTAEEFVTAFAAAARVTPDEVPRVAGAIAAAFGSHLSNLAKVLERLPHGVRQVLTVAS